VATEQLRPQSLFFQAMKEGTPFLFIQKIVLPQLHQHRESSGRDQSEKLDIVLSLLDKYTEFRRLDHKLNTRMTTDRPASELRKMVTRNANAFDSWQSYTRRNSIVTSGACSSSSPSPSSVDQSGIRPAYSVLLLAWLDRHT
jgi:hypothetical protein